MGQAKQRGTKEERIKNAQNQKIFQKEIAFWQKIEELEQTYKLEDKRTEERIAEVIKLDTPFGRMVDKLNKSILNDDIEGIKSTGIEMNNYGGMSTMQEAVEFFVKKEHKRLVDMYWDGIGEWLA